MKKHILILTFLAFAFNSFADKIKAGVVVFGNNTAAIAAAIQSAQSGVKTVLVDEGNLQSVSLSAADQLFKAGIYADLLQKIDSLQKKNPATKGTALSAAYVASALKGWTDTIKNLTVFRQTVIKKIKKDGKDWEIEFTNGDEVKPDVVVDATDGNVVAKKAGFTIATASVPAAGAYTNKLYRTGVAAIESNSYPATLPISALLTDVTENLILLGTNRAPSNFLTGQAAGATAAFCAFFNTTTKKLNVRAIQGELLGYKSQLLRFDDISEKDSTFAAVQRVAITGILKGELSGTKFLFNPDGNVSTSDLRLPIREFYSRSQIWFLDNKQEKLTVGDALSLIKFTAGRGEELNREVEKGWNTSLKLEGKFDATKAITRRETAVLFDNYLKPFDRAVDLEGNLKI